MIASNSAIAPTAARAAARLTWLIVEARVNHVALPRTRHSRFRAVCGSPLPSLQMVGQLLVVPVGSLDAALHQKTDAHLFVASTAYWDAGLEQVRRCAGLPQQIWLGR